jgi:GT2 family glycosyltransferase
LAYNEDGEFSWGAHARGFKILYVPTAIVYHDYSLNVSPWKIYHLEKGRYIILRKYLRSRQILSILPALIMTEILTWGYAILRGPSGIKFKLKGFIDGIRTETEKIRTDGNIIKKLDVYIPEDQLSYTPLDVAIKKIANKIYEWNYRVVAR